MPKRGQLYGLLPGVTRYMAIQLHFDRESFDALKELLRIKSQSGHEEHESGTHRLRREALKRVFDQIRDVEYRSG